MGLTLITPPASMPVTLTQAKAQCRVLHDLEDDFITGLIAAATDFVDGPAGAIGECLVEQTWELVLDAFSASIKIPLGPLLAVDSIKYIDPDNAEQIVDAANYVVDTSSLFGWVVPVSGFAWPATTGGINVVRIRFRAGYATVPPSIVQAILLIIGHRYDNRAGTDDLPDAVASLLRPHKRMRI